VSGVDLETASKTGISVAALPRDNTDDLRNETLDRETDAPMFAGQGRQRTASSPDHDPAVALVVLGHGLQHDTIPLLQAGSAPGQLEPVAMPSAVSLPLRSKSHDSFQADQGITERPGH